MVESQIFVVEVRVKVCVEAEDALAALALVPDTLCGMNPSNMTVKGWRVGSPAQAPEDLRDTIPYGGAAGDRRTVSQRLEEAKAERKAAIKAAVAAVCNETAARGLQGNGAT